MKRYFTQALWTDHQDGMHVAHAPPPGMVEPPIPVDSEEDDEHEHVEHVDLKAVSLEGLRHFVKSHRISPTMTTRDVVRQYVIPATTGTTVALVDTQAYSKYTLPAVGSPGAAEARKAAGPAPPYTRMPQRSGRHVSGRKKRAPYSYVVHAWSRPFMEMVNMLEKHFAGRPAEHTYLWLDIFAIPQQQADHSGFLHEIQRAIWYASHTLACVDPSGAILGRLWCLYEMFYTLTAKQAAHALVALMPGPITCTQRTVLYKKINAKKAQCSVKEDRRKLEEHVHGYTRRGYPAINNYLRSGLILPPYDHTAVFLPQLGHEKPRGLKGVFGCGGAPPPPPPPKVPDHIADVPAVPEPSVRKGQTGAPSPGGPLGGEGLPGWGPDGEQPLRLCMGACNVPHPSKTKTGGEDAFFLSAAGRGAMGVADGVGSWSSGDGVDPALYSRDLMHAAASSIEASCGRIGARMALADAHLTVKHAGSSTGLVGLLPPDSNVFQVINMGDSGLRLFRGGRLAMATRPQAHAHNMPYQLACPDEPVCDTDSTIQGDVYNVHLEVGDVIIMASDGMFDNVWPDVMTELVNKIMSAPADEYPDAIASVRASVGASVSAERTASSASADLTTSNESGSPPRKHSNSALAPPPSPGSGATVGPQAGEEADGIGKHAAVAGDKGETIRADASTQPLPPHAMSMRAARLARTLARTAAANMLRKDVRTPFAVELSKQPSATAEFRANPRGGKPDDVTVAVAVVVEADVASLRAGLHVFRTAGARDSVLLDSGCPSATLPASRAGSGKL
ncbi:hypothetical protein HYH03_014685 [Edaphochlamys debaryana]|uniref:PPM-type phosphatase domain-containing protein n=1 Tax=Edaphochlamys debaryana TaxID=47281 RepID=A0A836BTA0_9CHLO|nr:hypothetical protein HYH03_014685 [Edaphochlamys debaryana]|eukprot:KAG2486628.1 hypothetical protein HYH03_014685 [Edaphochlamys debaryana]